MHDLVKRLRERAEEEHEMLNNIHEPLLEAADRIEALEKRNKELEVALRSIAANSCCDTCQEAALVARAALAGEKTDERY